MYGNSRRSRTRSPVDDFLKRSILAKANISELKNLRVAIRRGDVTVGGELQLQFERSIDDPASICSYVHFRKDKHKTPKPPIFGRGIKVNQDFTENRRVFTHETRAKKSRSRSQQRSRSRSSTRNRRSRSASRNKRSISFSINRSRSRKRSRNKHLRSRSREGRSKSKCRRSRSQSRYRSRSRERRYSSDRREHEDNDRYRSRQRSRYSRSPTRSRNLYHHKLSCPFYGIDEKCQRKSLSPLRPGEYRPGHPDLALGSKRNSKRSRSRSCDDGGFRFFRAKSRSPVKRTPFPHHSGSHEDYGYFKELFPGPGSCLPIGRGGGFGIHPFYAPPYYPRGMPRPLRHPGPLSHPGLMMPRMPIMIPFGPYRPHSPIYNSGAARWKGPRPDKLATITISEQREADSNVIPEETSQNENGDV